MSWISAGIKLVAAATHVIANHQRHDGKHASHKKQHKCDHHYFTPQTLPCHQAASQQGWLQQLSQQLSQLLTPPSGNDRAGGFFRNLFGSIPGLARLFG